MEILKVTNLQKVYSSFGKIKTTALKNINFNVKEGEFVAIMGESGAGKTTLLNLIATLDKPSYGDILINGQNIKNLKEKQLTEFRRQKLGFVFQDFNLLQNFNNKDNIFLPLVLSGYKYKEMEEKLKPLSTILGIEEILNKYPYEISGGQKQRIAIARALITNPSLILADEPTGALDSKTSANLMKTLKDVNKQGQTIIMVTHSLKAASFANRVIFIKDGILFYEVYRGDENDQKFMEKINDALILATEKEENL